MIRTKEPSPTRDVTFLPAMRFSTLKRAQAWLAAAQEPGQRPASEPLYPYRVVKTKLGPRAEISPRYQKARYEIHIYSGSQGYWAAIVKL